jgi:LDH2 family malate/lactate/ureidoglycolate dehydrogenase
VNGPFVIAINISPFVSLAHFIEETEDQCRVIKESAPANGFNDVLLPGEPELANREIRKVSGIPIPNTIWSDLTDVASELGVTIDDVRKDVSRT